MIPDHNLVVTFDGEDFDVKIVCLSTDRVACGVWVEPVEPWPPGRCACVDPACPCRQDDHGACGEYGQWIEPINYSCRLTRSDECWFVQEVEAAGWQDVIVFPRFAVTIPILDIDGATDEPIEFDVADTATVTR